MPVFRRGLASYIKPRSVVDGRVMGEPRISPLLAAFLCFAFMCGAVAAMSELDFGSPLNLLAELGNGE